MSHKLLLADDSVTIQKVIELTFADEDIEVIAVSTGSQAIARAPIDRPDIVLADVGMPDRDGYEVAAFIKRTPALSHVPVLLLTGAFEPIDEGRAKAAGCDGVLVKPFEPQMVITRVKDLIAGKRPMVSGAMPGAAPSTPLIKPPAPPVPADQYFDRLNAALGSRESDRPGPGGAAAGPTPADLASELADWRPGPSPAAPTAPPPAPIDPPIENRPAAASVPAGPSAAPRPAPPAADRPSVSAPAVPAARPAAPPTLAEAFAALLAAEQGKVAPPTVNDEALREEVIAQVTRRVVERMTDKAVRDVVLEVAERLVREEIARIKGHAR